MKNNMINKYSNNILSIEYNKSGGHNGYLLKLQEKNRYNFIEYYYKKEELISTFPLSEMLNHKSNTLLDTDKVYFTKSSSIPRYKLKEFLELTKIALNRTNRIDQATTYIASINAFKELVYNKTDRYNRYYVVPADDIIPYAVRGYKTEVNKRNLTEVLLRESDVSNFPGINVSKYPITEILAHDNGWGANKLKNVVDSFVYLADKKDKIKIIFDETLIEMCNSGVVIDEEIYENILSMLNSNSDENISLAMEIISNSDLVQSKLYLILLLNECYFDLKKVNKTTNFQSLLNYFSSYMNIINQPWESFVDSMLREHCENDEEKALIKKYILRRLNEHLGEYGKLKLKDITI
jgi:hypothetical protein